MKKYRLSILILRDIVLRVSKIWYVFVLLFFVIVFIFLGQIVVGEPNYLDAKVISFGVIQGSAGTSILYVCETKDGSTVMAGSADKHRVGDNVEITVRNRILFSDVYQIHN